MMILYDLVRAHLSVLRACYLIVSGPEASGVPGAGAGAGAERIKSSACRLDSN